MSILEILRDVLSCSPSNLTLAALTTLVANHSEYRGKSNIRELRNRVLRILRENEQEFNIEGTGEHIKVSFKVGRLEGNIKWDMS